MGGAEGRDTDSVSLCVTATQPAVARESGVCARAAVGQGGLDGEDKE